MLLTYLGLDQTPGAETKHISTNTQTYNLLLCIVTDRPQSYYDFLLTWLLDIRYISVCVCVYR